MLRRETELDQQRTRGEPAGKSATLDELLAWYAKEIKVLTPWGRTKEADIKRLRGDELPMADIIQFVLVTARRQEEITRIKWADLDRNKGIAWLDVPYTSKSISAAFTRAVRLLGLSDLHFHDLRHEATSCLCRNARPQAHLE